MTAPREEGFTLVEMLVSLALLGLATLLVVQGFTASRGAWRRLEARDRSAETVASAQTRLRDRLEQMSVQARFETTRPYIDFDGENDRLEFLAEPLLGEAVGPITRQRLSLTPDGTLVLAPGTNDGRPAPSDVLLGDVAGLEIDYFGADAPGGSATWRDAWTREPGPPELVRVRVAFPRGDRRTWPELIVRPAAMVDADCVLDPDTGVCRGRA